MSCPDFTHLLVLPHLKVHNANAISSPLTHGFPAMTAFQGLMWALQRKLHPIQPDLHFAAVGVVCHDYDEQVSHDGFVKTFRLTRNPVGKNGKTAAIVEEGRIHLDISLVLAIDAPGWPEDAQERDVPTITRLVHDLRIAGGTLAPHTRKPGWRQRPWLAYFTGDSEARESAFRKLRARLLPGSTLVARDDLIARRLTELQATTPEASRLDAWLSLSRINWRYDAQADDGKGAWQHDRAGLGWVVPIPVGYGALGPLHEPGSVANARDTTTPFRFVESLYSIGEWIGPHRLNQPQDLLWYADSQDSLYRCRNDYHAAPVALDDDDDLI